QLEAAQALAARNERRDCAGLVDRPYDDDTNVVGRLEGPEPRTNPGRVLRRGGGQPIPSAPKSREGDRIANDGAVGSGRHRSQPWRQSRPTKLDSQTSQSPSDQETMSRSASSLPST